MAATAGNSTVPFPHPIPIGLFHLNPDPPAADPAAADPAAADPAAADPPRTFTQEQVDRIIADRIARVKTNPPDDYEDLKAKAAKLDEIEAANLTELEKERARADKAEADRQAAIEAANRRLVEAAILAEAATQKAIRPEHLHRLINTDTVTVGDDGQVAGVKEAVEAFLTANPEYVGSRAKGSADLGARGGASNQLTRDDLQKMSSAEIVKAQSEGRLDHLLGAA